MCGICSPLFSIGTAARASLCVAGVAGIEFCDRQGIWHDGRQSLALICSDEAKRRQIDRSQWLTKTFKTPSLPSRDVLSSYLPPPDPGLVAEAGVAIPDFLCIFFAGLAVEDDMLSAPDAPDTVLVGPLAFGLLMPVPPCPEPPPPAACAKAPPDIPANIIEINTAFLMATRMALSSGVSRRDKGVSPPQSLRKSHAPTCAPFDNLQNPAPSHSLNRRLPRRRSGTGLALSS